MGCYPSLGKAIIIRETDKSIIKRCNSLILNNRRGSVETQSMSPIDFDKASSSRSNRDMNMTDKPLVLPNNRSSLRFKSRMIDVPIPRQIST